MPEERIPLPSLTGPHEPEPDRSATVCVNAEGHLRINLAGVEFGVVMTAAQATNLGQDLIVAGEYLAGNMNAATFAFYIDSHGNA